MNRVGNQFFAGSRFAHDQNIRIRFRHRLDRLVNRLHLLRRSDDVEIFRPRRKLPAHIRRLGHKFATLERLLDQRQKFFEVERFFDEIERAGFGCFDCRLYS